MKYILLCVLNVLLVAAGQMFFRAGAGDKNFNSPGSIIRVFFTPMILTGFLMYAMSTILWLYILSKIPISRAYPIQALIFPLVLVLSRFLFNEQVTPVRWIGVGIIFIGVIFIAQ